MIHTTIKGVLDKTIDPSGHRLYMVKDDSGVVLYVGQSKDFTKRIRQHVSSRLHACGSVLGHAIYDNKPHSDNWPMTLYTVDDCIGLIEKYFPKAHAFDSTALKCAEDALIHEYNPVHNKVTNNGYMLSNGVSSPFLERIGREQKEEWRQHELDQEQRRLLLVQSVCDICGEYDTWINANDGKACGLIEGSHGFHLICHECNDVMNLMERLKRNPERVRKIEEALAKPEHKVTMAGR